jgi:hypothetical protein
MRRAEERGKQNQNSIEAEKAALHNYLHHIGAESRTPPTISCYSNGIDADSVGPGWVLIRVDPRTPIMADFRHRWRSASVRATSSTTARFRYVDGLRWIGLVLAGFGRWSPPFGQGAALP